MAEPIAPGTWVEIHRVVLSPEDRVPQVPADTKAVPLEMRVKGFLTAPALVGDSVEVLTGSGRHVRGTLVDACPAYTHGFGPPIAEIVTIGREVRALLDAVGEPAESSS